MGAKGGRVYSGVEVDERVAQRRSRLLEAGLDILGDPRGDDDLTLRVICRRSGLAQRYFYESFADKDVFAAAVYDWAMAQVIDEVQGALASSTFRAGTRVGVTQLIRTIAGDRRIGEMLFGRHQTNDVIVAKRFESTAAFVALFSAQSGDRFRPDEHGKPPLISHFLVGGVAQAIAAWLNDDVDVSEDRLAHQLVTLLTSNGVGQPQ
ncbi:TetR/AcrR family transcriptional regulator [Gordonia sp. ABSL49_1]|uniref:TetR/AcrR family transcriptional regulator n=1 Tax=Gordonia sp. ABSL49_1 TaxID=2920941 RepID=UPI001F0E5886|nr:TetR/AcrR family transcriptional regulator [Gordonia sp. ABSL49_1]MCH5642750.1 TetR/AcrR family transcriptional regulator [Gordonia sp. ABSL49_1]